MPRVKRGNVRRAKRKKLLSRAKGFYQTKSKLYRAAKQAVDTAGKYAFVGRKQKKRDYRRLWVIRINAAARENGLTYGQLMAGLKALARTIFPVPVVLKRFAAPRWVFSLGIFTLPSSPPVRRPPALSASGSSSGRCAGSG